LPLDALALIRGCPTGLLLDYCSFAFGTAFTPSFSFWIA
jgi:hypothetical protein